MLPLLQAAAAGYALARALDEAFDSKWSAVAIYLVACACMALLAINGAHLRGLV